MYVYIYIYIYIYIHGAGYPAWHLPDVAELIILVVEMTPGFLTVSSHKFNSQNVKLKVSNPRSIAYIHLKLPLRHSNLPGSGPIIPG